MPRQKRDNSGNFDTQYEKTRFLSVLRDRQRPLKTTKVADIIGCSRRRAHERLTELEEEGKIFSNRAGNSREWSFGSPPEVENRTLADYAAANLSEIPNKNARGMVIAIQQPHSRDILNGEKKIEFRRGNIKQENRPEIGFIYEPSPTQAIVGVFEVESVDREPISELIEMGIEQTPSTRESLEEYFEGLDEGTAIHIKQAKPVSPPVPLNRKDDTWRFNPPQSFYYVDPQEFIDTFPQTKEERPPGESQQSGSSPSTS